MSFQDPNSPQVLATFQTEPEAALIVNHLDALGIRAEIWRDEVAYYAVPVRLGVRIIVRQADLVRAKEALNRIRQERPENGSNGAE